jgi:hypothetical protein
MTNTWSKINGSKSTGNRSNNVYSHLNSQGNSPRGKRTAAYRELAQMALTQGYIASMTDIMPDQYLQSVVNNAELRAELRLTAAGYLLPYRKSKVPHIPKFPPNYKLGALEDTASCQRALRQLIGDVASGVLTMDAAESLYKLIPPLLTSLEVSEVRAELESFRQLVEQAKEQRDLEARLTASGEYEVTVTEPPLPDTDILK